MTKRHFPRTHFSYLNFIMCIAHRSKNSNQVGYTYIINEYSANYQVHPSFTNYIVEILAIFHCLWSIRSAIDTEHPLNYQLFQTQCTSGATKRLMFISLHHLRTWEEEKIEIYFSYTPSSLTGILGNKQAVIWPKPQLFCLTQYTKSISNPNGT